MAALAEATGSVISAVMLGALAGAGALPFPRAAFEAAIRRGGVGVATSLAAFAAGFEAAHGGPSSPPPQPAARPGIMPALQALLAGWSMTMPAMSASSSRRRSSGSPTIRTSPMPANS